MYGGNTGAASTKLPRLFRNHIRNANQTHRTALFASRLTRPDGLTPTTHSNYVVHCLKYTVRTFNFAASLALAVEGEDALDLTATRALELRLELLVDGLARMLLRRH